MLGLQLSGDWRGWSVAAKAQMLERLRAMPTAEGRALGLLPWTSKQRAMLRPDVLFDLSRHSYLRNIYSETAQKVVLYKASQMGASEYLISYALHACDQRGATVLYIFPTDRHVSDFSSARIGPGIEASPYLAQIVIEGGSAGGKRGADRITLKRVRNRFLYLRGAKVDPDGQAPQLKAVDADALVLDEWDEMDPRAPIIARKRLGHSLIAEERIASTPTYTGRGIHAEWLESDQREWYVQCEHCGEWQSLTIHQIVEEWDQLERPVAWHGRSEGRAWLACGKCGQELNRLGPGRWVAAWPGREVAGYHLTRLFSGAVNLLDIVQALCTTDETERREAFNQDLGEPYVPRGGQLTDEVLDRCVREYAPGPVQGEDVVMGIDVGRVLHGVIRGPANVETGERAQRWAGEIDTFEEAARMMKRFGVRTLVMDALPETTKARELQAQFERGVVWLAYYVNQRIGTKRENAVEWDGVNGVVNLDRTRTLDMTLSRFYDQVNTLPAHARDVLDYYAHLKATVRVLEDGPGGQRVARYVESGPDHLAHAENYCTVATLAPPLFADLGWV